MHRTRTHIAKTLAAGLVAGVALIGTGGVASASPLDDPFGGFDIPEFCDMFPTAPECVDPPFPVPPGVDPGVFDPGDFDPGVVDPGSIDPCVIDPGSCVAPPPPADGGDAVDPTPDATPETTPPTTPPPTTPPPAAPTGGGAPAAPAAPVAPSAPAATDTVSDDDTTGLEVADAERALEVTTAPSAEVPADDGVDGAQAAGAAVALAGMGGLAFHLLRRKDTGAEI